MIDSMTGYGHAKSETEDLSLSVEVRSVNNRYLKVMVRGPEFLSPMEADIERVVREGISRGAVTVTVYCRRLGPAARPPINEDLLAGYVAELERLAAKLGVAASIDITELVSLPGVLIEEDTTADIEPLRDRVLAATAAALADFKAMRRQEGQTLEADLRKHVAIIRENLAEVEKLAPSVVEEYRNRLMDRIGVLMKESSLDLARESLLGEVSIFAERSDISEELSRLESHLVQFDELLEAREPAGRKLEFLAQEMLREANTTGSKSGSAEISRRTVEVKAAIDRIKEQVQNAE
jgi:uncharacterized protein (TIGR00255 family)